MRGRTLAGLMLRAGLVFACLAPLQAPAQNLAALESQVTTFTLDNGLQFLVAERHEAPVFSYVSIAKVGSVNEVPGITGLAHMFEHMAFKGTPEIGTKDYKKEKKAMAEVDRAHATWWDAKIRGASESEIESRWKDFEQAQEEAAKYVVANEFGSIIEQTGGSGLNASTQADVTTYFYNLPSNKLELWAYLESERFERPVLREFYKERDVVMEERRMRTESSPIGRLVEEFLAAAYLAHPYGQPTVGHRSDLQSFTREDALDFYDKYYVPSNVVMCLVGDVDPQRVRQLAEKYFGDWKREPTPEPVRTVEPPQKGERRVVVRDPGQPFYIIGYHKPAATDPDDAAYDVLVELLANGRSSRIHKRLVKEEKKAVAVGALTQFPGLLYPGLLVAFAVPAKGVTAEECEGIILEEVARLKTEPVPADELEGTKTRLKASWVRSARSNSGFARLLVTSEALLGDWKRGLQYTHDIDAVTADDIQRIAKETFTETNRTVGLIRTEEGDDAL